MLFNQITVAGRLGRDPEMTYTTTGKAVTKFSIAVDQGKDQPALWLNVVAWERLAERISEQAHKGMEVLVQGRLSVRSYDDKNGVKRQAFEIIATSAQTTSKPQTTKTTPDGEPFSGPDDLGTLDDHPF